MFWHGLLTDLFLLLQVSFYFENGALVVVFSVLALWNCSC